MTAENEFEDNIMHSLDDTYDKEDNLELHLGKKKLITGDKRKYIADSNHDKVKDYLGRFNIQVSIDLEKNCARVFENKRKQMAEFVKGKKKQHGKSFDEYSESENFALDLDEHWDAKELEVGFEGFDDHENNFLPIVASMGGKILKGGIKMIKNKIAKKKGNKSEVDGVASKDIVHEKVRDNVLAVGVDKWLTDNKKKQIQSLLAQGEKQKLNSAIKAQLFALGVPIENLNYYQDAEGNFDGKTVRDVLGSITGNVKENQTKVAMADAYPKLILMGIGIFILGFVANKYA